jgi:hypothetical protein
MSSGNTPELLLCQKCGAKGSLKIQYCSFMPSKGLLVDLGHLAERITAEHQRFAEEITMHTVTTRTSELFRLPSEGGDLSGVRLLFKQPESFLTRAEREGGVPVDWSYRSFVPRITKKKFVVLTPALVLSVVYQCSVSQTGGKVLFPLPNALRVFCGKSMEDCVLVWDGTREFPEGIIACLSSGPGATVMAQFNAYDATALNGYWPRRKGKDPLIRHLSLVPVEKCNLTGMRIAVVRRR